MSYIVKSITMILTLSVLVSGVATAQWVYVGKKAMGKVRQLTGDTKGSQQPGYDVATVLLEAGAEKVYSTAVNLLEANKNLRITRRDDRSRTVDFTDGTLTAGLHVSRLDDTVSQLLIASSTTPGKADATSAVLNAVFRVCREMSVHCELAHE